MSTLRMTTAGESHGPAEVCVLSGVPAGLTITTEAVDRELARRQVGYGRGGRMAIETDRCRFLSGVRHGSTLGTPDRHHRRESGPRQLARCDVARTPCPKGEDRPAPLTIPRPGHADLAGHGQVRPRRHAQRPRAGECPRDGGPGGRRSRLQEAAGRAGSDGQGESHGHRREWRQQARADLAAPGIHRLGSRGGVAGRLRRPGALAEDVRGHRSGPRRPGSRWVASSRSGAGVSARGSAVTLAFEDRLDGRLLGALGSIPAIKGVEIGYGFANAARPGSKVHDPFVVRDRGRCPLGGPVEQQRRRARGRDEHRDAPGAPSGHEADPHAHHSTPFGGSAHAWSAVEAHVERSDVTAVPAARVVAEAMVAYVVAAAYLEKFGGDQSGAICWSPWQPTSGGWRRGGYGAARSSRGVHGQRQELGRRAERASFSAGASWTSTTRS